MQRDMELIRAICRQIVERGDVRARKVQVSDREDWLVQRHVELLWRAGYLEGAFSDNLSTGIATILVKDLSWEGHEFADALLNDTAWEKVKTDVAPELLMRTPLKLISTIMGEVAASLVKRQLGLDA